MELHHIHSYGNGNHGFYLNGINYSNFYGCYADTNAHNGFEINNTSNCNFYGCWAYKSNQTEYGYGMYVPSTSTYNNFYGCKVTIPGDRSQGSYNNGSITNVYDSCTADSSPVFNAIPKCRNCYGELLKYNISDNEVSFASSGTISSGTSQEITSILNTRTSISSPGVRGFEMHYIVRNNANTYSKSGIINFTTDGSGRVINYNGDSEPPISLSGISVNTENGFVELTYTIVNNVGAAIRVGGFIRYIGTDRGN